MVLECRPQGRGKQARRTAAGRAWRPASIKSWLGVSRDTGVWGGVRMRMHPQPKLAGSEAQRGA
jgi:hypothetical protein